MWDLVALGSRTSLESLSLEIRIESLLDNLRPPNAMRLYGSSIKTQDKSLLENEL